MSNFAVDMTRILLSLLIFTLFSAISFADDKTAAHRWSNPSSWFEGSMVQDPKKVDVFYLVSTDILSATDDSGKEVMQARLTKEDIAALDKEIKSVKDRVFYNEFNFISPYYHQYTYNALLGHVDKADSLGAEVGKDAGAAFDYYMKNMNKGRPFILVGFSQGGDMAMRILRQMTEEQYRHMAAAYIFGWKITAADTLNYSTIKPAKGETDTGVTISYNSVLSKDGIWDIVTGGTKVCINPVNWKTDATPAEFMCYGKPHKAHVEWVYNVSKADSSKVLIIDTDPEPYHKLIKEIYPQSVLPSINPNSLHHWEIWLFSHQIHDNALKRAKRFVEADQIR